MEVCLKLPEWLAQRLLFPFNMAISLINGKNFRSINGYVSQSHLLMAKTRIPIPDNVAAEVMFASDRTCCVCREPNRKTEIHHIDGDPSNNDISNLAVVCKDHQSDAHTNHAFARNLSADVIRKYNKSWRVIVRARLSPGGDHDHHIEYQQQVLLEVGLAPHAWKVHYMAEYPGHFRNRNYSSAERKGDVWDMLLEFSQHKYSIEEWNKYHSLFDFGITNVTQQLDGLLASHGDVIPVIVKLAALRTTSQLMRERSLYQQFPMITQISPGGEDSLFLERFKTVIRYLSSLARSADQQRDALAADT